MKKALHISIISVIIVAIIFTALMIILKYDEKGETNMPFDVSKISIISTVDAQDLQDGKNTWNKSIGQDNDIYIYIDKNENYKKTETIEKIEIDNFQINEKPQKGKISIYKPSSNEKVIFENTNEYKVDEITFLGEQSTNMKKLQISNQGGIIQFRVANEDLGNFVSSGEQVIEYKDLLKKINITEEELKTKISFDMNIILGEGKQFKATINLEIPAENIVETGKSSKEMTDLDIVFKRVEN